MYRETSPRTRRYNCAAWANGVDSKWWQALPGYYWPRHGVPNDGTIDSYEKLYELCGFVRCDDGSLQAGEEKIALFGKGAEFEHVARQLPDGRWTSKLGTLEDIEHADLEALSGDLYGNVVAFMRRTRGHPLHGKPPTS
jgi:hypothetical protein